MLQRRVTINSLSVGILGVLTEMKVRTGRLSARVVTIPNLIARLDRHSGRHTVAGEVRINGERAVRGAVYANGHAAGGLCHRTHHKSRSDGAHSILTCTAGVVAVNINPIMRFRG